MLRTIRTTPDTWTFPTHLYPIITFVFGHLFYLASLEPVAATSNSENNKKNSPGILFKPTAAKFLYTGCGRYLINSRLVSMITIMHTIGGFCWSQLSGGLLPYPCPSYSAEGRSTNLPTPSVGKRVPIKNPDPTGCTSGTRITDAMSDLQRNRDPHST